MRRRWLPVRRYGIFAGVIVLLLTALWVYFPANGHNAQPGVVAESGFPQSPSKTELPSVPALLAPERVDAGILERIRHHEVDFVGMLNEIRERCLPEWNRRECNAMARDFLQEKFRGDNDADKLLSVYDQYIRYEDYVAENRAIQNLDIKETYRTLQQLRAQFIDADIRRWLFGVEDARMNYEFAFREFMNTKAPNLQPLERLRALYELRRQHLGEYFDLFVEREDPLQYYQTELTLLQMSKLNTPEERARNVEIEAKIRQASQPTVEK